MAKEAKNKKENNKHFWKDFKAELKKVIWPSTKQVANNTTAVITIVLLTAIIVFVLDLTFETLNTHGVDKLRSIVKTETNSISQNSVDSHDHEHDHDLEEKVNTITESNTISE